MPEDDTSNPNGSSIALLAEFQGKRVLLGADAYSEVLELDCAHDLASTSGATFRHPVLQANALVIEFSRNEPALHFDFASEFNRQ